MEQNTEKMTFCLTDGEKNAPKKEKGQAIRFAVIGLGLVLIMISISAHVGIAAAFFEFFNEEKQLRSILSENILPPFRTEEAFSENEKTDVQKIPADAQTTDLKETVNNTDDKVKNSISMDLSTKNEHGFALKNETTYNPDLEVLWNSPNPIEKTDKLFEKYTEDEPLVLIYHTHATESYIDTNDSGAFRSNSPERNMIAIGKTVAETLESSGIKTLHLTDMFDASSYNSAYNKSAEAVKKAMDSYPSLRYVIDIHRDSVTDENNNCVSADFTYEGENAAQMMFVVGTDEGGSGHTKWRENLTTVLHLQDRLCYSAPSSMRPVNLRKASFYQDRSAGAMLLEIGTIGNTLEEAKISARIFANALADYMMG